ncbi:MAG: MGH1-like glycoside hydrolase domain-containing protein [Armatimonadota bacterium]
MYKVKEGDLVYGSSLGNAKGWATSKGTGAIENLYSIDTGKAVLGSLVVGYFVSHNDLSHFGCPRSPLIKDNNCDQMVMLSQDGPAEFHLHPAYQRKLFSTIGMIDVSETFFLPRSGMSDDAVEYLITRLTNRSEQPISITIIACLDLVGDTSLDVEAKYDAHTGGLIAWNQSNPNWIRAFCSIPSADRYVATSDIEESYDPGESLSNETDEVGRIVGSLQINIDLEPDETKEIAFTGIFSPDGYDDLTEIYDKYKNYNNAFNSTLDHYESILKISDVVTPDTIINQGGQWSKANMLRVLADYPFGGTAFTNDPGLSSNVVARDVCWYVYGCDYVTPLASCTLLNNLADLQQDSGKLIEYYNALNGETADYGLNINDNTPLFILAVAHHLNATGHRSCIDNLYPHIVKAAEYIISQKDERGLIYCTAVGTGVYGIAGWRNIIRNRNINGAVTEINSECFGALRAISEAASAIGTTDDYNRFAKAADDLRNAINTHLLNPKNGTYYLNIDTDGNKHTEVTADEIFPLLFGITDESTGRLISTRLSSPDFMTSAGLRTVPSQNPLYMPDKNVGLEGGVWPGVTWWYAIAASITDPSLMVNALKSSYRHYIEDPGLHNTVPGQFSEWFDGQSLSNRGMRLSPWEPPRYLWALLEGAVGINIGLSDLRINPRIPLDWRWLILKNLPYHNRIVSMFMVRLSERITFYTSSSFNSNYDIEHYEIDLSDKTRSLSHDMHVMAYGRTNEVIICLASASSEKQTAAFVTEDIFNSEKFYKIDIYSSETGDWSRIENRDGRYLSHLSAWIEPGGFCLMKITNI